MGPGPALMSIAIIINPIAGAARPRRGRRRRVDLARRVAGAAGEAADVFVTESSRPCARAGRGRPRERRAPRRGVGRRRHGQRGGVGAGVRRRAAGDRAGRIGQRPRARARGAGRPERRSAAAVRACRGTIDVGEIGGRLFVNVAGIGFDAHVAARFNDPANRRRGFSGLRDPDGRRAGTLHGVPLRHLHARFAPFGPRCSSCSPTAPSSATASASRRARGSTTARWISWWWRSDRGWRRSGTCRGC